MDNYFDTHGNLKVSIYLYAVRKIKLRFFVHKAEQKVYSISVAIEDLKIKSESRTWQRNDPVLLIQVTLLLSPTKTTYIRDLLCNTYYRDVGTM